MGNYKTDKINARFYAMKLYHNTDADIIKHLDRQENKQAYLKSLIREDIRKAEHKTEDKPD